MLTSISEYNILLVFYENVNVYVHVMALIEKFKPYVKPNVKEKLPLVNLNVGLKALYVPYNG